MRSYQFERQMFMEYQRWYGKLPEAARLSEVGNYVKWMAAYYAKNIDQILAQVPRKYDNRRGNYKGNI